MYKHIFFDLDHTLWDFETNSKNTLEEIYTKFNLFELGISSFSSFAKEYYQINEQMWDGYRKGTISKEELRGGRFNKTLNVFGINNNTLAEKIGGFYVENSPQKTALFPNCHQLLSELKNREYRLHIITNGFKEVQYVKLENSNLSQYFDVVVTSEEAGAKKPHPTIFSVALKQAQAIPENSIMVGDNIEADIIGAANFGLAQVFFNPNNYESDFRPTYEIKNLIDLLEFL